MSCPRELKQVQLAAPPAPEVDEKTRKTDPTFRAGYIHGFQDAMREALEIVEEHEEENA